MPKKPTAADAQLVLQLYDLRREAEMRKARAWWAGFSAQSADEVMSVLNNFGSQENAWLRQVTGYWEMAASLVLRGALNEDLFFDSNGEMWFTYAKVSHLLPELRKKLNMPHLMARMEKLAKKSKAGRDRLADLHARFEARRKTAAKSS